ncbi:MAG: EAL domain-containing protein [Eubacteriales bacterium]|nr:EAL domain-containing protein [Eubacteriales bacterium]
MQPIIYFDIAAIAVLLVLLFTFFCKKITFDYVSRIFLTFIIVVLCTAVCSLVTALYSNIPSTEDVTIRYVLHTLYLLLRNSNGPLYVLYILALSDTFHKYRNKIGLFWLFLSPYFIVVLFLISNIFTHSMFYLQNDLIYTRGKLFFVLYISAGFYMVLGVMNMVKNRRFMQLPQRISLYSLVVLSAGALLIQWKNSHVMVEMFSNALSAILMLVMVQKPDDVFDSVTGLKKRYVFANEMWRNYENDKAMSVVFVQVVNYSPLLSMLGFERLNRLAQEIARELTDINMSVKSRADTYFVNSATFAIVACGKQMSKTEQIVEKVLCLNQTGFEMDQMAVNAQISVCTVSCPSEVEDFDTLMDIGDNMARFVETTGQVVRAADIMAKNRFGLADKLDEIIENALAKHRFQVYYQPIYSIQEKRFVSAEALLRLWDDEYGFISPAILIPAAEKSGAIHRIGDFVMDEVCQFIASEEFKALKLDFIEVNLSVAQCMRKDLADSILRTMYKYGIASDTVNLEITETAASYSQNSMVENLNKLSEVGIKFALDDYGTGYSNIERVVSLPLNIVKLDKTFVDGTENPRMWIALQNTVRMMKDMKMQIVVEGVETEELVNKIKNLECDFIQGYYYSKPIPKDEFITFLKNNI